MNQKPVKRYIVLLFIPYVLLFLAAVLMMFGMFVFSTVALGPSVVAQSIDQQQILVPDESMAQDNNTNALAEDDNALPLPGREPASTIKNVLSTVIIAIDVAALLMLLLTPLWVYLLITNSNYNNKLLGHAKSKQIAVTLAVAFGLFGLLYTYDMDKALFWLLLVITLLSAGLVGLIAWIVAIVIALQRSDEYYYTFSPQRVAAGSPL